MKGSAVLFSHAGDKASVAKGSTDNWGTPQAFYDLLHKEFSFTLDPCAAESNAKAAYFDEAADGLAQDWGKNICFVNFPYSQAHAWARKCIDAANKGATVVALCAARTDTVWWQELATCAFEVRFIKGRLAFVGPNGQGQSATFPSCVLVLQPGLTQLQYEDAATVLPLVLWDVPADVRR